MAKKSKQKIQIKTLKLFKKIAGILEPPKQLTVSEWADNYRRLSAEASAEPGRWRTDRAPYQREIMDSVADKDNEVIVIMSSAQVGKTEILNNIIGYFMDYDPSPILLLQPTLEMAEAYSKDRLAPMLRDTPALSNKIGDAKARNSGNTLLHKTFPGGHITMAGANSPSSLASRPIRILLADEVDRYPASAGTEGDPVNLAAKRTTTFWNKKKVYVSTPTEKGISRIEKEYEDSTKEQWCLPCPVCGKYQPLTWPQIKFEDVTMECNFCRERCTEHEWKSGKGKWIPQNIYANGKKRGFHLNALASPWESWSNIIKEFLDAKRKGKDTLKVFINTFLGESWEDQDGEIDEIDSLKGRRFEYKCEVPSRVLVLTAGVDVQDDRLEVEVVGWGLSKISWGIQYKIFYGDPGQQAVWNQLDTYLSKTFYYESKEGLNISCACVDTGGHYTDEAYKFCKPREYRRIFGIKGNGGDDNKPFIGKATRSNRAGIALFHLNVDKGKETVISRLKLKDESNPGYCHFPLEQEKGYNEDFLKGLNSERRVRKFVKGVAKYEWKKKSGIRNEPLDLRNYATAALEILNPDLEALYEKNLNGNVFNQGVRTTKKKTRKVLSKGV